MRGFTLLHGRHTGRSTRTGDDPAMTSPSHAWPASAPSGWRRLYPLAIAAALAGCASLQQPAPAPATDPTPAGWTAAAVTGSATDLAGWWTRFGDPALAPLIEQALRAGTDVDVARARLRQARAQRDLAEAGLAPRLDGSGSAQGGWTDNGGRSEQYRVGLDAGWEADLWGAGAAGVLAAQAG